MKLWFLRQRDELKEMIRKYKPLVTSVRRARILMIGPVGAGKSSFFNSINSIFTGHVTNKAISGFAGTSVTTQVQTNKIIVEFKEHLLMTSGLDVILFLVGSFAHIQWKTVVEESRCHLCCVTPWDSRSNQVQDWILRTSTAFFKVMYQTAIK